MRGPVNVLYRTGQAHETLETSWCQFHGSLKSLPQLGECCYSRDSSWIKQIIQRSWSGMDRAQNTCLSPYMSQVFSSVVSQSAELRSKHKSCGISCGPQKQGWSDMAEYRLKILKRSWFRAVMVRYGFLSNVKLWKNCNLTLWNPHNQGMLYKECEKVAKWRGEGFGGKPINIQLRGHITSMVGGK